MSRYYVVNESTEDTIASTASLDEAVHAARIAIKDCQTGDLLTILEIDGKAVGQFTLLADGTVIEHPITKVGR